MKLKKQVVGWFEIPVVDMDRAVAFYESVFDFQLERHKMGVLDMSWFPSPEDAHAAGASGSLVKHPDFYQPQDNGTLVYFTAISGDLNNELNRAEAAGGKIVVPKTQISEEHGYMGVFLDCEGNRIGLHQR